MKFMPFAKDTGLALKHDDLKNVPEGNIKYAWVPRIKCNDCPGKQYTAAPDNAEENFAVHLKNRLHTQRVDARLKGRPSS